MTCRGAVLSHSEEPSELLQASPTVLSESLSHADLTIALRNVR